MCGLCGLVGFYETGNIYTAVALLFIGVLVYVAYIWGLRRTLVLTPNAISTGELHDRVAELAKRFRVAVPLVSLLPSGRSDWRTRSRCRAEACGSPRACCGLSAAAK